MYACPLVHALRRHGEEEREDLLLSILSEAVASGHWTSEAWMLLEDGEGDRSAAAHAFWGLLRRWCNLELTIDGPPEKLFAIRTNGGQAPVPAKPKSFQVDHQ